MIVSLDEATEKLKRGEAVALPTETVYGLAAVINQESAVRSIFSIKERPFFDPLIVHISKLEQVHELTTGWGSLCQSLSQKFWPGPLTFVVPKTDQVSSLITSGLTTVGIRMPSHPLALEVLRRVGIPLAAPSANKFGKTSPTLASHVESEFLGEVPVLDGGPCAVGLESTVLWVSEEKKQIAVLRKGAVLLSQITETLSADKVPFTVVEMLDRKESPGHMKHHYMPAVPFVLVHGLRPIDFLDQLRSQIQKLPKEVEGVQIAQSQFQKVIQLDLSGDAALASREFYGKLREAVLKGADGIYFEVPKDWIHNEDFEALLERMHKAASLQFHF